MLSCSLTNPKFLGALLLLLMMLPGLRVGAQTGDIDVHDPVIIKEGNTYTIFSTGQGISIKKSPDMLHWKNAGSIFGRDKVPAWTFDQVPGFRGHIWAPDVSFHDDRFYVYYSISTFKSGRSAIGLVTNATLDPDSPNYKWEDQGIVVTSYDSSDYNAIDPNLIRDEQGRYWLNWGSFWTGMKTTEIDPSTGKPVSDPPYIIPISNQGPNHGAEGPFDENAIEAPFIVLHDGYYYQFVSLDLCCRGADSNYKLAVGRSKLITGPYVDRDGVPMLQGGATLLMAGYGDRVHALGHNAVYSEGDRDYIVHHMYDKTRRYRSVLQIRPLKWDEQGWPVAGGAITEASVAGGDPKPEVVTGDWTMWTNFGTTQTLHVKADGMASMGDWNANYKLQGDRLVLESTDGGEMLVLFAGVAGDWLSGRRQSDGAMLYAERQATTQR